MKTATQHILLILLLCLSMPVLGQVPGLPAAQQIELKQFLADRDIDETELRARLEARGIEIDGKSPEELLRLRPQIEAVITEMEAEAEQAKEVAREAASKSTEKIQEAVEDGATVEEAITDVTTEEAGEKLTESLIYGHQIFRNKSLQVYRATDNATPPDSYPLKEGDEIAISIFGASQTDFILRLDDNGFIRLPNGLRMPMAGISLGEARTLLGRRLRQYYTFQDGQLSIRIQVARTVSVNIFGEVETSGSYSMSSLNTGFNALVAAGGPTERGSVRKIQLINGKDKKILDVYDFLQSPVQKTDLFLFNNSTLFVPVADKIVTVAGGVQRPMQYELIEGEQLDDLIAYAGAALPAAEVSNIRVTRYQRGALRVINVDLEKTPDFELLNGDLVQVPIIENPIEDFVAIAGAVLLPGRYAFEEDINLTSLVDLGRLRPGARTDVAFLFRSNDDGTSRLLRIDLGADAGAEAVKLQRGDSLQILSKSAFRDTSSFYVEGAVRDSAVALPFPQDGALTLEEAILLAGGVQPNAAPEVMLIRTPLNNQEERTYKRLDLRQAGDFLLQPLDRVLVYGQERFTDRPTVSISGAIRSPGTYTYDASLNVRDLLYLAGDLRIDAARDRVEVFRLQFTDGAATRTLLTTIDLDSDVTFTLQPFDEVIVRSAAEYEKIQNIVVEGEVRYPGRYALLQDNERLSDIVRRAGGLTEEAFPAGATLYRPTDDTGYIVLDLDRVVNNFNDPANMVLRVNDTLFIPKKRDLVTILTQATLADRFGRDSTTVSGTIKVAFQGNQRADWYIENYAGGFNNKFAKRSWTTVEYASGQVKETNRFLFAKSYPRVEPGSIIRAGVKPLKPQREERKEPIDWGGIAQATLAGVTSFVTLFLLLQR